MNVKRVGIFGTSGMAREAGDVANDLGYTPLYVARDQAELNAWNFPAEAILESEVLRYQNMPFVIGIGENNIRERVANRYRGQLTFCNLIHTSATFGYLQRKAIECQQGIIVCAGVRFTNTIQVGDFCIFNQNSTIAHDVVIGGFVHVAPGSTISGNVDIGNNCWIGAGAVLNQGTPENKLLIGSHTTIGSGAVVTRTCESNSVYAGVPAQKIK
jgi:sugar O-acyltransferase (sialic acid O-acetyltransferase NeuD family)